MTINASLYRGLRLLSEVTPILVGNFKLKTSLKYHKPNSKYHTWFFTISNLSEEELYNFVIVYTPVLKDYYIRYRVIESSANTHIVIVETEIRQRIQTFSRQLIENFEYVIESAKANREGSKYLSNLNDHSIEDPIEFVIYPTRERFDELFQNQIKYNEDVEKVLYTGNDIKMLDDPKNRFEWQNTILKIFYDEEEEEFKESDDRTVIWVQDKKGLSGKSSAKL